MTRIIVSPLIDSKSHGDECRRALDQHRDDARILGETAVEIGRLGFYETHGTRVSIADALAASVAGTVSIRPDDILPAPPVAEPAPTLTLSVENVTTFVAAKRLIDAGAQTLALNFASGSHPGGGFLHGARAQEETLARSSGLYATIQNDPMYDYHHSVTGGAFSSAWAILSPDVPVFRTDDGTFLRDPWLCSMLTCAAPVASRVGLNRATPAMGERINRALAIARAYGYRSLVLGAWGCGAFHNDTAAVAALFRAALTGEFLGAFDEAVFAIADWSEDRHFLAPFAEAFGEIAVQ